MTNLDEYVIDGFGGENELVLSEKAIDILDKSGKDNLGIIPPHKGVGLEGIVDEEESLPEAEIVDEPAYKVSIVSNCYEVKKEKYGDYSTPKLLPGKGIDFNGKNSISYDGKYPEIKIEGITIGKEDIVQSGDIVRKNGEINKLVYIPRNNLLIYFPDSRSKLSLMNGALTDIFRNNSQFNLKTNNVEKMLEGKVYNQDTGRNGEKIYFIQFYVDK